MTIGEFDEAMNVFGLNYSIGVIFNLDSAADYHKRARLLAGKNDEAAAKDKQSELEYQRLAFYTAIDETFKGAVTFESKIPEMSQDEIQRVNEIIKLWNKYLAHFDKRVPEIGE